MLSTTSVVAARASRASARRRGLISALGTMVLTAICLVGLAPSAAAAPTLSVISGEIQQITLNNPADVWSGGWIRVGGQDVVLPRNLLIDLPANRLTLQQIFRQAPKVCTDLLQSGLSRADSCNLSGTGGFATIQANRANSGDVIAGDVFIEKGREIATGEVTFVNSDDGYFRVAGVPGSDSGGTMVRLNDPTSRHTIQTGPGCASGTRNCSADPRFALDADNYTNAFSTGYPMCIPSTVSRQFVDTLDLNQNADVTETLTTPDATGADLLCPASNRNAINVAADSRLFAPIEVGDSVTVRGNTETVGGVQFLSAFSTKIGSALSTVDAANQPDYMVLDSMFIDGPAFQRLRIRDEFIGATTEADSDVLLWSVHRDPRDNASHEFPLGTVQGCEAAAGLLTCRRVLGPNTFRIRHDTLFVTGAAKNTKLSACSHMRADPRFLALHVCPQGGTASEEFGILSPMPREVQARTGRKYADLARPDGGILKTLDVSGNAATNGQFAFPMGMGLGGIEMPNFAEIDVNKLSTPISFDGIPWDLDRRLSPNGCVGGCESTPQPLDPFPLPGFDPRTQGTVPNGAFTDPVYTASPLSNTQNRILSYVDPAVRNFNGDASVLAWPPVDPAPVGPPPPPPPVVTNGLVSGVTPAVGPVGTSVVIDGVGLTGASAVTFGGVAATTVTPVSDAQVAATVPVGAVTGPIAVKTPNGVLTSVVRFTVVAAPTVSSLTPASGPPGITITVTGSGFAATTAVTVGGGVTSFTALSDTAIRVVVPSDATTGPITVTSPGGTATSPGNFTVVRPPAPIVTGFTPSNASPGSAVTIVGTSLATATGVFFNGTPATTFSATDTTVTALVPPAATSGPIAVFTAGGSATSAVDFQVTAPTPAPPAPAITSFAPTTGSAGTPVAITGTNFTGTTAVTFGGVLAVFQLTATGLVAVVPAGAGTGALQVFTPLGGVGISTTPFTVTAAPPALPTPTVASFTPTRGAAGTTVVITGTNFTGASAVSINGTPVQNFTINSANQITAVVGAGSTTGAIRVVGANGIATSATSFVVPNPGLAPVISSFTPTLGSGAVGTVVVLTGLRFTGTDSITINGTPVTFFTVSSPKKITMVVGAGTTTGPIVVHTTTGGAGTSVLPFTAVPAPAITDFLPRSGNSGTTVVVTGTGFTYATSVLVSTTPARSFTVDSDTQITFVVGTGTITGVLRIKSPGGTGKSVKKFTVKGVPL